MGKNPKEWAEVAAGWVWIRNVPQRRHRGGHEGVYRCWVGLEGLGAVGSSGATVINPAPLRSLSLPTSISIFQGDPLLLPCQFQADPTPKIRWQKDREDFPAGNSEFSDPRMALLPSGTLQISGVRSDDAGSYRCLVKYFGSSRVGNEIEVKVLEDPGAPRPPRFLRRPTDVKAMTGSDVIMECSASGNPQPAITWFRGDDLIPVSSKKYSLVAGSNLRISAVTEGDSGPYSCTLGSGSANDSGTAQLQVLVPPFFLTRPSNLYAWESWDVELECAVSGKPTPTVRWLKNGEVVIPGDYFQIVGGSNLRILGLVKSDEGFYQCMAENEAGNSQSIAQLIILEPELSDPSRVPGPPQELRAPLVSSRSLRLQWRPPAQPRGSTALLYTVLYSRQGNARERALNTSLAGISIGNLEPETSYEFRIVASNEFGAGKSSETLRISTRKELQLPGPVENFRAAAASPSSILIFWDPPTVSEVPIQGFRIFWKEAEGEKEQSVDVEGRSFRLEGLKKFLEYQLRILAFNWYGAGIASEEVLVRTLSDVPSAAPRNVSLEVVNSRFK
ncbi:netrin receptor DCC-like [Catharus ustulatus]|uniref:netrin receptor DCC-like n=1 Tax=Catharus ustulatus TaxID=91951 RepID=UPI00140A36CB|nr:netrin receptor DCC-like [Catharus ustulatus]